ncbi:MAG TPA: hypothetical protein VFC63_09780 [Blastocatellia bacterium]|nr:hypothetical protein [Blastocatellia bacterium]
MKRILVTLFLCLTAFIPFSRAQQSMPQSDLLDHLVGKWILKGTLGGKETTHYVDAEWVLNREYMRLYEVSQEKNPKGSPAYEAIIFIEQNPHTNEYTCLWLDSTEGGGLSNGILGRGKPDGDKIPFVFNMKDEAYHNTFIYNRKTDTWQWTLDGEKSGPFARLTLTKR